MYSTAITRSSVTAERQRVSHARLSRLAHWSCTSLNAASVIQLGLYNRVQTIAKVVSTLSANTPCNIRGRWSCQTIYTFRVICFSIAGKPLRTCIIIHIYKRPHISRYLLHNVNSLAAQLRFVTLVQQAPAKIRTNLICSESRVHWPHFCRWTLSPMLIQSRMSRSKSHNIRRSSVPSIMHTLSWLGHSRSFKVILICASRNEERCVVVMCN